MSKEERNELAFKLRKETGDGVMDCKKALDRFDYDYDKALGWLKLGGHLKYMSNGRSIRQR